MAGTWIRELTERGHSGHYRLNFLWREGPIFVMDNHRAALWCWLQLIDPSKPHSLFHIDRHPDALSSKLDLWFNALPDEWNVELEEYLNWAYTNSDGKELKVVKWDNYLSLYARKFGSSIEKIYSVTHRDGDEVEHDGRMTAELWDLPRNFDYWLGQGEVPWIVNLDLDYFFCDAETGPIRMVSDDYIRVCAETLKSNVESGRVAGVTIALTPSDAFTGGWTESERAVQQFLGHMDIAFKLPGSSA